MLIMLGPNEHKKLTMYRNDTTVYAFVTVVDTQSRERVSLTTAEAKAPAIRHFQPSSIQTHVHKCEKIFQKFAARATGRHVMASCLSLRYLNLNPS
jgi:hypothetical protein